MSARRGALPLLLLLLAACGGGRGAAAGTAATAGSAGGAAAAGAVGGGPNATVAPELAALAAMLDTATARGGTLAGAGIARVVLVDTVVRGVSGGAGLDLMRFPAAYTIPGSAVREWRTASAGERRFRPAAFEYRTPGLDTAIVLLARDLTLDAAQPPRAHFALLVEAAGSEGSLVSVVLDNSGGRWTVVKLTVLGQ